MGSYWRVSIKGIIKLDCFRTTLTVDGCIWLHYQIDGDALPKNGKYKWRNKNWEKDTELRCVFWSLKYLAQRILLSFTLSLSLSFSCLLIYMQSIMSWGLIGLIFWSYFPCFKKYALGLERNTPKYYQWLSLWWDYMTSRKYFLVFPQVSTLHTFKDQETFDFNCLRRIHSRASIFSLRHGIFLSNFK